MKYLILFFLILSFPLSAQTIAEKKESFKKNDQGLDPETYQQLSLVNSMIEERQFQLKTLYETALKLYNEKAEPQSYEPLLQEIKSKREEIEQIQKMWQLESASCLQNEEYALWHQPETTLQQLVMDYGSFDYIYLIPPEIGGFRISMNSSLPLPRESWGECLELILTQYGVGIRQLNPFLRELYVLRNDISGIKAIIDNLKDLDLYPAGARLCYVLQPHSRDMRADLTFLQRFSNSSTTYIEAIGGKIFIIGTTNAIQELMKLHGFVNAQMGEEFQLVTLTKIEPQEMHTILNTAFFSGEESSAESTLRVFPLQNMSGSLFLCGHKEEVKKAIALIKEIESQVENPQEKTVFWYTAKHSDAEELAKTLAQVYDLLLDNPSSSFQEESRAIAEVKEENKLAINPSPIGSTNSQKKSHKTADGRNNFVVDPKTSSIIMVVEQDALAKIKDLLKKLDVPKKMVQLEVLLFEKKVSAQSKVGLNLLRIGSEATQKTATGLKWLSGGAGGILEFLISRSKGSGIPAYDLAYQFLLGQEDVQINASPSVTTMNQTPAKIAIVEEISIDSGSDEKNNRIYSRTQYGIIIEITPTINFDETAQKEGEGFITLDTDIVFDTPKKNQNDRPDVTRRKIKNHVRIADGQTVILGGLRRKSFQDNKESIPFLGEIPYIGKLFSHTEMSDSSTEMFIFITPKIISDPVEDAERIRKDELKKRPGDVPEFLAEMTIAREKERKRLFEGSLTALFGRELEGKSRQKHLKEYDGK